MRHTWEFVGTTIIFSSFCVVLQAHAGHLARHVQVAEAHKGVCEALGQLERVWLGGAGAGGGGEHAFMTGRWGRRGVLF